MKTKKPQFNTHDILSFFFAMVIGVSLSYVGISGYTKLIEAQTYSLFNYINVNDDAQHPACPNLIKVEALGGAIIVKDTCTNVYWNRFDLPNNVSATTIEGYTWKEATDYCAGLAVIGGDPVFRLPTADELFSLVEIPCEETFAGGAATNVNNGCSPITRQNATYENITTGGVALLLATDPFYLNTYPFAEGAYWTKDELDMNNNLAVTFVSEGSASADSAYEAASSVNLRYGTINNPIFGKKVRLNARCIYDKPSVSEYTIDYNKINVTAYDIDELQWWSEDPNGSCPIGTKKVKMAYRKNLQPKTGDVNACPEGLNTSITGEYDLCTGITEFTDSCVVFSCANGMEKGSTALTPIVCN